MLQREEVEPQIEPVNSQPRSTEDQQDDWAIIVVHEAIIRFCLQTVTCIIGPARELVRRLHLHIKVRTRCSISTARHLAYLRNTRVNTIVGLRKIAGEAGLSCNGLHVSTVK